MIHQAKNNGKDYLYFFNRIYNFKREIVAYECLLRKRNNEVGWELPENFDQVSFEDIKETIKNSVSNLPGDNCKLVLKLTSKQFLSRQLKHLIEQVVEVIKPRGLILEISHDEIKDNKRKARRIKRRIIGYQSHGIEFSINNIGSNFSYAKNIHRMLPYINYIKLDLKYFNNKESDWIDLTLKYWTQLSKKYQINLIITGIETAEDEKLVNHLSIDLRQGYFYGGPKISFK